MDQPLLSLTIVLGDEYYNAEVFAVGNSNVDEYLQKGMYGVKETKPDERRKFLGTIRERVVVALTRSQVMEQGVYPEVEQLMSQHPKATLYLNGELDYSFISDYIQSARAKNIPFSIVTNKDHRTILGLCLPMITPLIKKKFILTEKNRTSNIKKKKRNIFSRIVNFLSK